LALRCIFNDSEQAYVSWRRDVCREISGCSIGAIIGLFVSLGMSWRQADRVFSAPAIPSTSRQLHRLVCSILSRAELPPDCSMERLFRETGVDFRTVCTQSQSGSVFVYSRHHTPSAAVVDAVVHSCAVPLVFHDGSHPLVDGMFADNYSLCAFEDSAPASTFSIHLSEDEGRGVVAWMRRLFLSAQLHRHLRAGVVFRENTLGITDRVSFTRPVPLWADASSASTIMRRWQRKDAHVFAHIALLALYCVSLTEERRVFVRLDLAAGGGGGGR
jgi:predicted acylesterase/phospholipase RssA